MTVNKLEKHSQKQWFYARKIIVINKLKIFCFKILNDVLNLKIEHILNKIHVGGTICSIAELNILNQTANNCDSDTPSPLCYAVFREGGV